MKEDIQVTFDAFRTEDGSGPLDLRVVIPKRRYLIVAEDDSYYYVQPVEAASPHALASDTDAQHS